MNCERCGHPSPTPICQLCTRIETREREARESRDQPTASPVGEGYAQVKVCRCGCSLYNIRENPFSIKCNMCGTPYVI